MDISAVEGDQRSLRRQRGRAPAAGCSGGVRRWGIEGRVLGSQVPARGRLCNAHGVRAGVSGGPTLCGQVHMPGSVSA